jgi:hypothetical protein
MTAIHRVFLAFLMAVAIGACTTIPRVPFTGAEQALAVPAGFPNVRFVLSDPAVGLRLSEDFQRAQAERGRGSVMLSLSGGGANGAYGAGVLYGWSKSGRRPVFDVVTGVSTGALSAPFAFLGPKYDEALRLSYTGTGAANLLSFEGLFALFRTSFYSAKPLQNLVNRFIDEPLMNDVAAEDAKGRRLMSATTNLDTQQLMLWDMGAIARAGGPEALRLFRQVMIASASVPGVFPPVMIDVEAGSRRFAEMHVDGATVASFFAIPETMLLWRDSTPPAFRTRLYLLINGRVDGEFAVTRYSTLPIVARSFDTMSKSRTRVAIAATTAFAQANGIELSMTTLPLGIPDTSLDFNQKRMTSLFELGRVAVQEGRAWQMTPETSATP